jgi:hypothetical protein
MAGNRDEFSPTAKLNLAGRAGQRCSNPNCGIVTSGPHEDEDKAINVGVAAHITAASPGGPRYNKFLTPDERSAITNAIWLCQKCAKLIDSDVRAYTEELIRLWKRRHEAAIKAEIEGMAKFGNNSRLPARLSIDAIFSHPSADNKACVLDIRVSNPGESDLMINAVQFQVLETVQQALLGGAQYSAVYDLNIGCMREYGSSEECQVAQILKPGEVDRFAIILSDPAGGVSVGGWRFATLFKTNIGNVPGPEIEVWLPRPKVIRSFDEFTSFWLMNARLQSCFTGKEFQELAMRPADPDTPDETAYSILVETGGGALAYPSPNGGYETFVGFDLTLGSYCGPQPLWERGGSRIAEIELYKNAAEILHRTYGDDVLEKVNLACAEFAKQGNAKAVENWLRVLEQVKLLIAER